MSTTLRAMDRMERLTQLSLSMSERYAKAQNLDDELAERRRQKQMWLNMIVARKMYARELESLHNDYRHKEARIERLRRRTGEGTALSEEYEALQKVLKRVKEMRRESGRWFVETGQWLQEMKMRLTANELKAALSVPDAEWMDHDTPATINEIAFVARIGDEAVCNHVLDEMIGTLMEADDNTKSRVRWHMKSVFGNVFE